MAAATLFYLSDKSAPTKHSSTSDQEHILSFVAVMHLPDATDKPIQIAVPICAGGPAHSAASSRASHSSSAEGWRSAACTARGQMDADMEEHGPGLCAHVGMDGTGACIFQCHFVSYADASMLPEYAQWDLCEQI